MNALFIGILGSGAREHALAWRLQKDLPETHISFYFYPGNGYLQRLGQCVSSFEELLNAAKAFSGQRVMVVGSEVYAGLADEFIGQERWMVWGPTEKSKVLEWSKVFSKQWMTKFAIPTAAAVGIAKQKAHVRQILYKHREPVVMKYDGLLSGKGVCVVSSVEEAMAFYETVEILAGKTFNHTFLFEEKCVGIERSLFLFVDRQGHVQPSPVSMDFKAKYDGNVGPNTGGMGSFTPAPLPQDIGWQRFVNDLCKKVGRGLKTSELLYSGVLYVGLMLTQDGPKVLEFNVRLGDPEAQTFLPALETSFWKILQDSVAGVLVYPIEGGQQKVFGSVTCATQDYAENKPYQEDILDPVWIENSPNLVFFGGLKPSGSELLVTSGRMATVVYSFDKGASDQAILAKEQGILEWVKKFGWQHIYFRTDLGQTYVSHRRRCKS